MNTDRHQQFPRRTFLRSGIGLLGATGLSAACLSTASQPAISQPIKNAASNGLADPPIIVDQWTVGPERVISDSPSLVRLPDRALLCAYPRVRDPEPNLLRIFRSEDDGRTWWQVSKRAPFGAGRLFLHNGAVYFLGVGPEIRGDIRISRSGDMGRTWTAPVTLFKEHAAFYNPSTGMVKKGDRLYWTFGAPNVEGMRNNVGSRIVAVAGNLRGNLLDPANWRISNHATFPDQASIAGLIPPGVIDNADRELGSSHWLEGNVVKLGNDLRVITRCRIARNRTINISAVCDLADTSAGLKLRFLQFHPLPGAQNQFHIIHDEVSGYYWMTSNLSTTPRDERRILALSYGLHPLCWFHAGVIAMGPTSLQAFNYTTPLIDGNDLLVVSRTSQNHHHDNDRITFHRLRNFRSLAMNITPQV